VSDQLYATFWVGTTYFGVDATSIQEVLRSQLLTRVLGSGPEVKGLLNLRGQVVVAIDLRERLAIKPPDADSDVLNVVAVTPHGPVSFLVDEIGDVLDANADELERPPETLGEPLRSLVTGVHKLDERLMLVLDVAKVAEPVAAKPMHPDN
jgi:purine-binding chemotaxis protein CheW